MRSRRSTPNNKEKMNEEMMKLYQEENYGTRCRAVFPMAIQMPILFGLYDVIQRPLTHLLRVAGPTIESATEIAAGLLNNANLAKDYSRRNPASSTRSTRTPTPFPAWGILCRRCSRSISPIGPIDLTQQPTFALNILLLIPILLLPLTLRARLVGLDAPSPPAAAGDNAAAAGMSKGMMLMMPLMSAWISFVVPAGLGVYWVISNLLMALQTFLLNRYMNPAKLAAKAQAEYEAKKEADRQAKIEAKQRARERGEKDIDTALSQRRSTASSWLRPRSATPKNTAKSTRKLPTTT